MKMSLQRLGEHVPEVLDGVRRRRLPQRLVGDGLLPNLVQEQLVRRLELGPEPLVEDVDQLGQLDLLVLARARAHGRWALDFAALAGFRSIAPSLSFSSR